MNSKLTMFGMGMTELLVIGDATDPDLIRKIRHHVNSRAPLRRAEPHPTPHGRRYPALAETLTRISIPSRCRRTPADTQNVTPNPTVAKCIQANV